MERRKPKKQADLILTADIHLREIGNPPVCRTDDYWVAQWRKMDFIKELQNEYGCMVLHAGDLFDHWKPSPHLLSNTIQYIPDNFYTIYGNHDLPQHSLELKDRSGMDVLMKGGIALVLNLLYEPISKKMIHFCHWGMRPEEINEDAVIHKEVKKRILIWHTMTYPKGEEPYPNCPEPSSIRLLKKYQEYDLIVTGDNHKSFVTEYDGRLLVNPGSMMRMDADQINHKPKVYLWYADTNEVIPIEIPIEKGVISREHIEVSQERDNRINSFVEKLNDDWETSISFEENLKRFQQKNKVRTSVMNIIYKSIEPQIK